MKIRQLLTIPRLKQIDVIFLVVITAFVFDFGDMKYAMAGLFVLTYVLAGMRRNRELITYGIGKEFKTILIGQMLLFLITAILQIVNGFNSYAINEAIYLLTPLILVWVYVSMGNTKKLSGIIDVVFLLVTVNYLLECLPNLNISNLKKMNLKNSFSVFENDFAIWFFVLEWYYLSVGNKKRALLSFVLCLLCFKRLCALEAVLLFVFQKPLLQHKQIKREILLLTIFAFLFLINMAFHVVNDDFVYAFEQIFGISLEYFTMSRSQRLKMVMDSDQIRYGLGSVTTYLTQALNTMHDSNKMQRSLHNDLVRIYLECGLLGFLTFVYMYLKAASFDRSFFFLMCFVLLESYVNPVFGAGSAGLWIVVYLILAYASEQYCIPSEEKDKWT